VVTIIITSILYQMYNMVQMLCNSDRTMLYGVLLLSLSLVL